MLSRKAWMSADMRQGLQYESLQLIPTSEQDLDLSTRESAL
jgi:hypothetical protein